MTAQTQDDYVGKLSSRFFSECKSEEERAEVRQMLSEIVRHGHYYSGAYYQAEPEYDYGFESESDYTSIIRALNELTEERATWSIYDVSQLRRIALSAFCEMHGYIYEALTSLLKLEYITSGQVNLEEIAQVCESCQRYTIHYPAGRCEMSLVREVLGFLTWLAKEAPTEALKSIGAELAEASQRCRTEQGHVDETPLRNKAAEISRRYRVQTKGSKAEGKRKP